VEKLLIKTLLFYTKFLFSPQIPFLTIIINTLQVNLVITGIEVSSTFFSTNMLNNCLNYFFTVGKTFGFYQLTAFVHFLIKFVF